MDGQKNVWSMDGQKKVIYKTLVNGNFDYHLLTSETSQILFTE